MNKVVIFYGSNRAFMEILPKSYRNLTDVVMELDKESKNMILVSMLDYYTERCVTC